MEVRQAGWMSQGQKAGEQGQGREGEGRGEADCESEGTSGTVENSHGDY